nr:hypothetical protein [Tanacetum cinerariifolium]
MPKMVCNYFRLQPALHLKGKYSAKKETCPHNGNSFSWAFLVTADVPDVYMKEFGATAYVHQRSIRFKMNNKKHTVDLESFREMLHICPRIPGQAFANLPFEEEILEFIRFLRHGATIRTLTDININKLYQPWRSFAAIINKCLTGKSSGYDSMESIFATASSPVVLLQTSTPIMTPSTIATITTTSHAPIPPTTISSEVLQNLPTFDSVFRFEDRLKSLEVNFFEYIQTNPFTEAVFNIPADLSEMELKKILIEEMEGNKSIQPSDEQRNLYKALVEAYKPDKIILDTYGETVTLKRRRDDESDKDEGPSAGSDRGSTTGSKSRQVSTSESAFAEEPVQTTCQMDEPSYPVFETGADD